LAGFGLLWLTLAGFGWHCLALGGFGFYLFPFLLYSLSLFLLFSLSPFPPFLSFFFSHLWLALAALGWSWLALAA